MVNIKTVPCNEKLDQIINILNQDGCIVIEDLLNTAELKALQSDLGNLFDKVPMCEGNFYGFQTKRISGLFTKSKICQKMATFDKILGVMDAFLLKGCDQYQINLTQGISIEAGEKPQIIHQDDPMFPFKHDGYEVMLNCMWAVDDFTRENGATYLVPGSHKWPRTDVIDLEKMRLPQKNEITQGVMKAGSVLIYLGSLYHSGGDNKTKTPRRGAVISYSLGWLKQAENSFLAYSLDEVRTMPERLQRLLGYFVHSPNLGSVDGRDPIELLGPQNDKKLFTEFIPEEANKIIKEYRRTFEEAA